MIEFKSGDVVELKSGSPKMTIKEVVVSFFNGQETGYIICHWFTGDKINLVKFYKDELVLSNN